MCQMLWLTGAACLFSFAAGDLCPEPVVQNGVVSGRKEPDYFFGEISCNVGYHLVGNSKTIKCRQGSWSQKELPVCSAIGTCPALPELHNGRNVPIQRSRGSAYRFKCNKGFKRFGEKRTHCEGERWSHHEMPVCAKATCDETGMLDIPYGEGRSMMGGAVYKYRCNSGIEMEGTNTVVCTGETWNGSVPHCNVAPNEPELSVIVSGVPVTTVQPGDWAMVTCQARGGHPVPDVGITMDGRPSGSKDFRNLRNSFTFTVSEKDDGKMIACTAVNKMGASSSSVILTVIAAPSSADITGPDSIKHNDEFVYECVAKGGNPSPNIIWSIEDQNGRKRELEGESISAGVSKLVLRTGPNERSLDVSCLAENSMGRVSQTKVIHAYYLPSQVEIVGPTTAASGEFAHLTCVTEETYPKPKLMWRIEKEGDKHEIEEIDADFNTETVDNDGLVAFAKIDLPIKDSVSLINVECITLIEDLGEIRSKKHEIEIITSEDAHQVTNAISQEEADYIEAYEHYNDLESESEIIESDQNMEIPANRFQPEDAKNDNSEEYANNVASVESNQPEMNLISLDGANEVEEKERSKVLWIPLNPSENIEDYQTLFEPQAETEKDEQEDFLRASEIPAAPMLKQEKMSKSSLSQNPILITSQYSSSSKLSFKEAVVFTALFLSWLTV